MKSPADIIKGAQEVVADFQKKLNTPATSVANPVNFWKYSASYESDSSLSGIDLFYNFEALDILDSNKVYGYEFYLIDAKTNKIMERYEFPINPQSINKNVPTAETIEATMKGIYSNHNGAPLRTISISGTTGTVPLRLGTSPANDTISTNLSRSLEYAFKNTIKAANSVIRNIDKTVSAFSGGTKKTEGPLNFDLNAQKLGLTTIQSEARTGYMLIHDLSRFLDTYLAKKKLSENKHLRLCFAMNKDKEYYDCILNSYSINKSAGTSEYQYTINLTAYRRRKHPKEDLRKLKLSGKTSSESTSNTLSNIINGLKQARTAVASAHGVMRGIRSDINESFITPVGEVILLTKEVFNLEKNMLDFAFSGELVKSMEESFKQHYIDNKGYMGDISQAVEESVGKREKNTLNESADTKLNSNRPELEQDSADSADPLKNIFNSPTDHPDIFERFNVNEMSLSQEISDQIETMTAKVSAFTSVDIIERREKVVDFSRSVSEVLGGGSASYNKMLGINPPRKTYKKLSVDDIVLLNNLNDIAIQMDSLASLLDQSETTEQEDYYKFYADYAVAQGLRFDTSNISRFFVPFPLGASLEQLAVTYLGEPERWIEIAALNALKSPYIDEEGYEILVTASAGGNTLSVGDAQSLYIGQVVEVKSDTERTTKRKIKSIDVVSAIETIITFEESTSISLTSYRPSQRARIIAFAPDTVNSNMLIAIPSSVPATFNSSFKTSPEVNELNGIARIAKVDFLLDATGDLIITGGGDLRLAYGMTNLVQAAEIKIKTSTDELLNAPKFGNPVKVGMNTTETTPDRIVKTLSDLFTADPRYSGILAAEVNQEGPAISISILVGIQDSQVSLPISADIPKQA